MINYGEPLTAPGFYFMDSPGNDLEGIAGQVAAGCNLILFVTGNGSITNFPFVPTLKVTTTTRRHQLLIHEMDINAGRYLDGETMAALTEDSFNLLVETASGKNLTANTRATRRPRSGAIGGRPTARSSRPCARGRSRMAGRCRGRASRMRRRRKLLMATTGSPSKQSPRSGWGWCCP